MSIILQILSLEPLGGISSSLQSAQNAVSVTDSPDIALRQWRLNRPDVIIAEMRSNEAAVAELAHSIRSEPGGEVPLWVALVSDSSPGSVSHATPPHFDFGLKYPANCAFLKDYLRHYRETVARRRAMLLEVNSIATVNSESRSKHL